MLPRIIKHVMVQTGMDNIVANLAYKSKSSFLKRLVPDRTFFQNQTRLINRYGAKFKVMPADLSQWFMYAGHTDLHVNAALNSLTGKKGIILDVGANIGHFSIVLAQHLPSGVKIVALEPNPNIFSGLVDNINLNPKLSDYIDVRNIGAGNKEDQLEILIPHRNSGAGSLLRDYSHEPHDKFTVPIKTLDSLVEEPVLFIKLDVEGFEYFVLQGAENIINRYHPAIYLETTNTQPHQAELFGMLKKHGYKFKLEQEDRFIAIDLTDVVLQEMTGLTNILAIWPNHQQ